MNAMLDKRKTSKRSPLPFREGLGKGGNAQCFTPLPTSPLQGRGVLFFSFPGSRLGTPELQAPPACAAADAISDACEAEPRGSSALPGWSLGTRTGSLGTRTIHSLLSTLSLLLGLHAWASADEPKNHRIELAGGKIVLEAPAEWVAVEPKFKGIVQYEFSIPKHEEDAENGRVTIGPTSGGAKSNLDRWIAEYVQPDGGNSSDRAKTTREKIDGATVHSLDVSGTYVRPPFSGGGQLKNHRLLAALIESDKHGLYYVKINGPEKTIASAKPAFEKMMNGLRQK